MVGVGLLVTTPVEVWVWDGWVMMDEDEFDLVGLGGLTNGAGAIEAAVRGTKGFSDCGVEAAVGVGVGVG